MLRESVVGCGTWDRKGRSAALIREGGPVQVADMNSAGPLGWVCAAEQLQRRPEPPVGLRHGVEEPGDDVGRGRERPGQEGAGDRGRREGGHRERRDHAEVTAAAAAQRPVEVGLVGRARGDDPAVGEHHPHRGHRVAGQPVRPGEHPDPAALGEPGDADGRARAARDPAAARAQHVVHLDEGGAGTDRRGRPVQADAGGADGRRRPARRRRPTSRGSCGRRTGSPPGRRGPGRRRTRSRRPARPPPRARRAAGLRRTAGSG